jgi:transcriptional regulator with XRE-family HTH domain
MNKTIVEVGECMRKIRMEHGLTIRSLAEKSGLNVNTLSMIENGKTSPNVATLQQLASALGISITAFFEKVEPDRRVSFQKQNQRSQVRFAHGALEELGEGLAGHGAEPFLVHLKPESDSGPTPIVHTGREFVYCLEGSLAYAIEGDTYILEEGDSLLFEAQLPHRWYNVNKTPSRAILVLSPAYENDLHVEEHFNPIIDNKEIEE